MQSRPCLPRLSCAIPVASQAILSENARMVGHQLVAAGLAQPGLAKEEADTSPEGVTASAEEETGARWFAIDALARAILYTGVQ